MKIYLAGPDVFRPNPVIFFNQIKDLGNELGFSIQTPLDPHHSDLKGLDLAKSIFLSNLDLIRNSDLVLANCNSFRGPLIDDGTAFEIGYAFSLKKKIIGYLKEKITLPVNVSRKLHCSLHSSGYLIDPDGFLVNEDFGNSINLMMEFAIMESGGFLFEGNLEDCLREIQKIDLQK
ncbi:MAG: nucleoside 2-deoxyribosyltransferase [Leptospiraceae bacterium]|nr:nucleoside 2-deoxyribosyltransferase [Leptospiraceae bacterium]MCP5512226.1 nucleoside 2-deoxyribosyltransferase [Leptospiraceae bacterium]